MRLNDAGTETLQRLIIETLTAIAPELDPTSLDARRAFRDQVELDSVDFLNFVLALERRLERRIPEGHYPRLSSLQGCLDYLGEPGRSSQPPTNSPRS